MNHLENGKLHVCNMLVFGYEIDRHFCLFQDTELLRMAPLFYEIETFEILLLGNKEILLHWTQ